jgi:DNA-binding protein HU-beta
LSRAEVAEAVDALFRTLKTTLMDGRPIRLEDFGSFEVQRRSGRTGVHPADGRPVEIPARRGVAFRPSRVVREGVASPDEKPGTPGKSGTERD